MIHQYERDALHQQIKKGDYQVAANIYKSKHIRQINRRYLQRFIEGTNNPTGARAGPTARPCSGPAAPAAPAIPDGPRAWSAAGYTLGGRPVGIPSFFDRGRVPAHDS